MFFVFLLLFTLFWSCQCKDNLKAVVVLFRHGDKTPTTSFPKDPYFDHFYWPMGFGQLTNKGKLRHYNLGKWLRSRYGAFLSQDYSPKEIYALSSDVDRTLMSASANLAGLFPPRSDQIWRQDLLWQPIPVHSIPLVQDAVVKMSRKCHRYKELFRDVSRRDFFKGIESKYKQVYEFVSNNTGWKVDDVHYFAQLQSVFYCYSMYNTSYLPDWAGVLDVNVLDYLAGVHYARQTFTDQLKALLSGPFFDYLFSYLEKILTGRTDVPKMLMISGHEETLAAVLNTMDVFDFVPPRFASAVIWELRRNPESGSSQYYINMLYKRNDTDVLDMLELKECVFNCSYNAFRKILEPVTVSNEEWERRCGNEN